MELVSLVEASRHRPVLYAHNELLRTYSPWDARRALDRAEFIVCVSSYLAERTRVRLPRRLRSRVVPVNNGVDCDRFQPAAAKTPHAGLRVIFVGRVVPEKGAHVLLEAVNRLGRHDVTVSVVGSAGFAPRAPLTVYEHTLRKLAGQGRASLKSHPSGRGTKWLPCCGRTTSWWCRPAGENRPRSPLGEGLATGLPVVASDVGGIPEVAAHRDLLVPPDDPDSLAGTLEWLATDAAERERMGRESREHAVSHDWGVTWRNLSALLDS